MNGYGLDSTPFADWILRPRVTLPEEGFFQKLEEVRQRRRAREESGSLEAVDVGAAG